MDSNLLKQQVGEAALKYVPEDGIIGIGTGSTVNYFIEALASIKGRIEGAVASSEASAHLLRSNGIPLVDLNSVSQLSVYIDGADEIDEHFYMIKGGGGALTREKIVAAVSKQFICIAHESKYVKTLGAFPLAVEVLPMARSYVAREMVKLGGSPRYRQGFTTDNGHIIIDVHHLSFNEPLGLEERINNITGVVAHGLFAHRKADILLLGKKEGVKVYEK